MNDESIFSRALDLEFGSERDQFLDSACANEPSQRRRIEELLAEHESPDSFFNRDAQSDAVATTAAGQQEQEALDRDQIANYRLLHVLGEGGMGTVYLAEQQQPVTRRVAVKIIKQGLNTKQFIARFEAERQALAMMDHPNIARVLDAGCTKQGLPYFVMEHVKGIPITEFCDENRLPTGERLQLFVSVCQAVQHAHQKGIIHRDLKPSNVMVAMYDDRPVPKVIDFGVAKATHQPLTEQTLCTIPGQIVGTWEYMSPEQAILNQLDVDTRTDIYSLGVILYELLTGKTPLDLKSLKPEALEERLRRIREDEPSRPSIRVSSLGQAAAAMATYRNTEAESLSRSLRGDLDWIVMKALEKDRSRRYETANGFAAEIGRYLNDEPLSFRPPSSLEQLARLCRRHKAATSTAFLTIAALAAGLGIAFWQYRNARDNAMRLAAKNIELVEQQKIAEDRLGIVKDYTMLLARTGNERDLELALNTARMVGASDLWELMLKGQSALESGNTEEAVQLLREGATRGSGPELLACKGLLASALLMSGSTDEYLPLHRELLASEPKTPEQLVFVSQGLILNSARSWELANRAVQQRPSPLAKLNRAITAVLFGADTGNLTVVEQGIKDLEAVTQSAIETPFTFAIRIQLHLAAMTISDLQGKSVDRWRSQAEQDVKALERHADFGWGLISTAWYKDRFAVQQADAAWAEVLEKGSGGWHDIHAAAMILRTQSLESWRDELIGHETLERVAFGSLLAHGDQSDQGLAMRIYDDIISTRNVVSFRCGTGFEIPLMANKLPRVEQDANRILDDGVPFLTKFDEDLVQYLAGRVKLPEFVSGLDSYDRTEQLIAHATIGLRAYAKQDFLLARHHFQQCRNTGVFHCSDYYLARAYLEMLDRADESKDVEMPNATGVE